MNRSLGARRRRIVTVGAVHPRFAAGGVERPTNAELRRVERLVDRLGPGDRCAAVFIVDRVNALAAREGQAAALRLVDEIVGILHGAEVEG